MRRTVGLAMLIAAVFPLTGMVRAQEAAVGFGAAPGPELLSVRGKGVQIYGCQAVEGKAPGWVLTAPDAKLLDESGTVVGYHGAGPVWRYKDGSVVHGVVERRLPAPEAGAVMWLELRAVRQEGKGLLVEVATIRRTETRGGVAPAEGCDGGHLGAEVRVPYSARYVFYGKRGEAL